MDKSRLAYLLLRKRSVALEAILFEMSSPMNQGVNITALARDVAEAYNIPLSTVKYAIKRLIDAGIIEPRIKDGLKRLYLAEEYLPEIKRQIGFDTRQSRQAISIPLPM